MRLSAFAVLTGVVGFHVVTTLKYNFGIFEPFPIVVAIIASVAVAYCSWRGQGWARIIIIVAMLMDLLNDVLWLQWLDRFGPARKWAMGLRLFSAVALLTCLSIPSIRTYFSSKGYTRI